MEMAYIGIDPGGSGAAALLTNSKGVKFHDWAGIGPAYELLAVWKSRYNIIKIGLEDPPHIPDRSGYYGVKGLWRNVGQWEGILSSLGLDWVAVPTKVWRRVVPVRKPGKNIKVSSLEFAKSMLPRDQKQLYLAKHHDRAEAMLIAVYLIEFDKIARRRIQ